jgi:hypothetical protein
MNAVYQLMPSTIATAVNRLRRVGRWWVPHAPFGQHITAGVKMRLLEEGSWAPSQTDVPAPRTSLTEHSTRGAEHKPPSDPPTAVLAPGPCDLLTAEQERVMVEHLPMVRFVARRIHERLPQHIPIEDLYSAGVLGLLDAFGKFDPSKLQHLCTISYRWSDT